MNIFLTYDYELFFGEQSGTAEKCILKPTEQLRAIASRHGVKMVFFIDTGYILKLNEYKRIYPQVLEEYEQVTQQIRSLVSEGHDCQLHIHPHWEDSTHDGKRWVMNTSRYKLADFPVDEIPDLINRHKQILENITQQKVTIYRAGGWCLQPFEKIRKAFLENGIKLDSTVFRGGKFTQGNYFYDFTSAPEKSTWRFSDDLCKEDPSGEFIEYPIASYKYSPLFFWKLFVLGRLNPGDHKPVGDGAPMASPGLRKKMLTKGALLSAGVDGYFVTKLNPILRQHQKKGFTEMVVLGHPKACTSFALKKLDQFIEGHKNNHRFMTFTQVVEKQ